MENTLVKGSEFETLVYEILYHTLPFKIELYYGGNDRGRDIVLKYNILGSQKLVIAECKNYTSSITQKDIVTSINWAVANKPDLFYIWVSSHLTPATKDYIEKISIQYNLSVLYEEKESIAKYKEALESGNDAVFDSLRAKILYTIRANSEIYNNLEYNSRILVSNHYLLDRKEERKSLKGNKYKNYYLSGASGVGKTQLAKVVAKYYYKKGNKVFWHRIISENENEYQVKCFLEAIGTFFQANYNDSYLSEYIREHGNYITNQLCNILNSTINKYHPIFFIDDIHKCRLDNEVYLELLYQIIQNDNCRCYFLGWFNIFDITKPKILNMIYYLEINTLEDDYIKQIAKHANKRISDSLLEIIVEKSHGFPGLAEVLPRSEELIYINNLEQAFEQFLSYLTEPEKELLIALVISRNSLPKQILYEDYFRACKQLELKRLIKAEGNTLVIHDRFKNIIKKSYSLKNNNSFLLLEKCALVDTVILIDILNIYLCYDMISEIIILLNKHFDNMIKNGLDIMVFNFIQELEQKNAITPIDIIIKKMVLLERQAEYEVLGMYLDLTEKVITIKSEYYYLREYLKYRFYYFKSWFNKMFNDFWHNFKDIQLYPLNIYIQILFIIGRTFYVQGDLHTATEIYYYIFKYSYSNSLTSLCIKAIHRICIIEEKLGLYEDTKQSLTKLLSNKYFISRKRLAFSYFRMSKCYLGLNDTFSAHKYNDKSIELKESLNAQRGLIFSYKLRAQIFANSNNFTDALYWASKAHFLANQHELDKEIISTGIVLSKIHLIQNNIEDAKKVINKCIQLSISLQLAFRLKTLKKICQTYHLHNQYKIIEKEQGTIEENLILRKKEYQKHLLPAIEEYISKEQINNLFDNNQSLSQALLKLL